MTAAPDALADGLGVTIDDGSGDRPGGRRARRPGRPDHPTGDDRRSSTGPLGQRDSSGTGTAGYRVHATLAGDLEVVTPPPTPTPTPTPSPTPTPVPTATPTPTPTPDADTDADRDTDGRADTDPDRRPRRPSPTPDADPDADCDDRWPRSARCRSARRSRATGVVIAEPAGSADPPCSSSATRPAASSCTCPAARRRPRAGRASRSTGTLAAPYGQLEIRPARGRSADPRDRRAADTDRGPRLAASRESLEGRLVTVTGQVSGKPKKAAERRHHDRPRARRRGHGQGHGRRVEPDRDGLVQGRRHVSHRRGRRPAGDPQRCPRRLPDLAPRRQGRDPGRPPRPARPARRPRPGSSGTAGHRPHRAACHDQHRPALKASPTATVAIEAIVTAPATLLDATGRRIVVQDALGRDRGPAPERVRRAAASGAGSASTGGSATPTARRGSAPTTLERARQRRAAVAARPPRAADGAPTNGGSSTITRPGRERPQARRPLARGDRRRRRTWLSSSASPAPGSRARPSSRAGPRRSSGSPARPYPTATRQALRRRSRAFPADLRVERLGQRRDDGRRLERGAGRRPAADRTPAGGTRRGGRRPAIPPGAVGRRPRRPRVLRWRPGPGRRPRRRPRRRTASRLDDGTAIGRIVLAGAALDSLALIEPDDALNAIGRVERDADGPVVVVDDPGGIIVGRRPGRPPPRPEPRPRPSPAAADPVALARRRPASPGSRDSTGRAVAGRRRVSPGSARLRRCVSVLSLAVTLLRQASVRDVVWRPASAVRLATLTAAPRAAGRRRDAPAERGPSTT